MADTVEYVSVEPPEPDRSLPRLGFQFGKVKFTVPNLTSPEFPLDLVPSVLLLMNDPGYEDPQTSKATAQFLEWFRATQPKAYGVLRASGAPLQYFADFLTSWAERSRLDPKA